MAQLAAEYLQVNRPDITLQYTQHLLQMGDKTAQVYYYDGFAHEQLGNSPPATYDLEQASNLDPTNLGVLAQLADIYIRDEPLQRRGARSPTRGNVQQDRAGGARDARQRLCGRTALRRCARAVRSGVRAESERTRRRSSRSRRPTRSKTISRWRCRRSAACWRSTPATFRRWSSRPTSTRASTTTRGRPRPTTTPSSPRRPTTKRSRSWFVRPATSSQEKKDAQGVAILQQMTTQFPKIPAGFVAFGDYYASAAPVRPGHRAVASGPRARSQQLGRAAGPGRSRDAERQGQRQHQLSASTTRKSRPTRRASRCWARPTRACTITPGARDACGKSFEIQRSPETLGCVAGADFELKNYKEAAQIFDALDQGRAKDSSTATRSCSTSPRSRTPARISAPRRSRPTSGCCR